MPERLATSSALPVTRPVAKRLAISDVEFVSVTASLTRFDSSSLTDDAPVAREFDETCGEVGIIGRQRRLDILGDQPGAVPQGRIELQVGELAGSSCAARMAPASRACGHSAAHTAALSAMHAKATARADPSRNRLIRENPMFSHPLNMVCRF